MTFGVFIFFSAVCIMEIFKKADARYCSFEIDGDAKHYICQRNEYCCNFGCCLSPTFQFYQLWYYWLMVIFMFLLCSGGQWWYRYWLQGRYTGDLTSSMPYRGASCPMTQPRRPVRPAGGVAYQAARDTVLFQHIWKPNFHPGSRSSPPPNYNGGPVAASSRDLIDSERLPGAPRPPLYSQLYGPPPSYDQVIGEGSERAAAMSSSHVGLIPARNEQVFLTPTPSSSAVVGGRGAGVSDEPSASSEHPPSYSSTPGVHHTPEQTPPEPSVGNK